MEVEVEKRILPAVEDCSPLKTRRKVLFPAPLGPEMSTLCPGWTARVRFEIKFFLPSGVEKLRPSTASSGGWLLGR